jgi:hypothetical protein
MDKKYLYGIGAGLGALFVLKLLRAYKPLSPGDAAFPKSTPYKATCSSGSRSMDKVTLIVLHSTEGDSIDGAIGTFAAADAGGSTQLVVGETGAVRILPDDVIPCGSPGANTQGLHVEMVGFANWSVSQWMARQKTLACAARNVADWCAKYGIPARLLSAADLLAGASGITSHANVSAAWKKSNHWDPGPSFPIEHFMSMVNTALSGGSIS